MWEARGSSVHIKWRALQNCQQPSGSSSMSTADSVSLPLTSGVTKASGLEQDQPFLRGLYAVEHAFYTVCVGPWLYRFCKDGFGCEGFYLEADGQVYLELQIRKLRICIYIYIYIYMHVHVLACRYTYMMSLRRTPSTTTYWQHRLHAESRSGHLIHFYFVLVPSNMKR